MASYQGSEGTYPEAGSTELHLAVYRGEKPDPASLERKATLSCEPDGGTHPRPAEACDALRKADGDIDKLPGDPGPCTREFNPVTATAEGRWQGGPVAFERTYGNPCELDRALTPVFDF
jgi:hypothetical protein